MKRAVLTHGAVNQSIQTLTKGHHIRKEFPPRLAGKGCLSAVADVVMQVV